MRAFEPLHQELQDEISEPQLVEPFFTTLEGSVYAVSMLPPELVGALCSRASRAEEDLRLVFYKEFVKPFLEESGEYGEALEAFVEFLHRYPVEKIFGNPKARTFFVKWLSQYGDDSIAQMAGTHLGFQSLSQLAIKHIEDMRVGIAPIEKSTRYVDYSSKINGKYRYYVDPTLAKYDFKDEYVRVMDFLFETYTELSAEYLGYLQETFDEKPHVLRAKAFDTMRRILPLSTLSQVAFFANGQSFEYMIHRCLNHQLGEIRWAGQAAWDELDKVIPSFLHRLNSDPAEEYRKYRGEREERVGQALESIGWDRKPKVVREEEVKLIEFDAEAENKILAALLFSELHDTYSDTRIGVSELMEHQKLAILDDVLHDRKERWYKMPRAFEMGYMLWEIVMNIGAWRDLHRHRMQTQLRELFHTGYGFDVPEEIQGTPLADRYVAAIDEAETLFEKIAKRDPVLAQYVVTMAHRVRFLQYQNVRQFFWEAELRTISQGHPDYRRVEHKKIALFNAVYPLLSRFLLADMNNYGFARRGMDEAIRVKEISLSEYLRKDE
jgi:thymidylate synthase ThyX